MCASERLEDEPSAAAFVHLYPARLATAAVPVAARDGVYRLDREPDPRGFALSRDGRVVGQLPWHPRSSSSRSATSTPWRARRGPWPRCSRRRASALWRVGALLAGRSA